MPRITIIVGALLTVLGLVAYVFLSEAPRSITAMIPAFFGVPLIVLGWLGARPNLRKHVMHGAVLLGVLGVAGTVPGLLKLPTLLSGGEVARPTAVAVQSIMAAICVVFVVLCVRSFIAARRAAPQADS